MTFKKETCKIKCENKKCGKEVDEDMIVRFFPDGSHKSIKICRECYLTGEWEVD